ncbi:HD-GYP domain-containing protein [Massilia yuzhufengensis]|uniref:HD-GYP domain, c-di-GMP phosphodiesterase class II (Or its inactivated variant) n=1 Tax=Massilia yuzhufengensis TaxID=1164594 RepID=A0A1I1DRS1_9BURK|nr:HD-GYP domain-containing protein [Massilia yuzhufengensis]SFB75738.1 HD-GYP domain, c-di-GMP phosphodiesterase class II (or its inactivated variant) [Massilia yuzhufengensis]
MLKKVDAAQLKIGMYIHDLDCGWMDHPFVRARFELTTDEEIYKIRTAKIRGVVIDCSKGLDVDDAPTLAQAEAATEAEVTAIAAKPLVITRVSLGEELARAAQVRKQAVGLVRTVMADARLGKAVELEKVGPVVESITESILRNSGALLGLLRIKNKDDYTFLHSVSVCALLVAFCRSRNMDEDTIYQAGLGGLLHDTGKALVPDAILNKAGRLTDEEFDIIKRHPRDGYDILLKTPEIGQIPLDITLHHHERRDGSGYPDKQCEGSISELAQMAAIVDVYDAITSDRCYHKGMSAAEALRKIYEWSKFHFNPTLAQEFMRCVGIYPVGTLVLLESGRLGVVIEPHETSLLTPKVNVFFSTKSQGYIKPQTVDLSKALGFGGGDKIVRHESPEKWNVNPMQFMNIA